MEGDKIYNSITNFIKNYVPHANFDCCLLYALRVNDECVYAIPFSQFKHLNFQSIQ